jgi:hypothetical protein
VKASRLIDREEKQKISKEQKRDAPILHASIITSFASAPLGHALRTT